MIKILLTIIALFAYVAGMMLLHSINENRDYEFHFIKKAKNKFSKVFALERKKRTGAKNSMAQIHSDNPGNDIL